MFSISPSNNDDRDDADQSLMMIIMKYTSCNSKTYSVFLLLYNTGME